MGQTHGPVPAAFIPCFKLLPLPSSERVKCHSTSLLPSPPPVTLSHLSALSPTPRPDGRPNWPSCYRRRIPSSDAPCACRRCKLCETLPDKIANDKNWYQTMLTRRLPPTDKMAPKGKKEDWEVIDTNADMRLPASLSLTFIINACLVAAAPVCRFPHPVVFTLQHFIPPPSSHHFSPGPSHASFYPFRTPPPAPESCITNVLPLTTIQTTPYISNSPLPQPQTHRPSPSPLCTPPSPFSPPRSRSLLLHP